MGNKMKSMIYLFTDDEKLGLNFMLQQIIFRISDDNARWYFWPHILQYLLINCFCNLSTSFSLLNVLLESNCIFRGYLLSADVFIFPQFAIFESSTGGQFKNFFEHLLSKPQYCLAFCSSEWFTRSDLFSSDVDDISKGGGEGYFMQICWSSLRN